MRVSATTQKNPPALAEGRAADRFIRPYGQNRGASFQGPGSNLAQRGSGRRADGVFFEGEGAVAVQVYFGVMTPAKVTGVGFSFLASRSFSAGDWWNCHPRLEPATW